MKKHYLVAVLAAVLVIAGLFALNHYTTLRSQQREQVVHLLSRCVNQSLLSMFRLQANNWAARPDFYRQESEGLASATQALPAKILDGESFGEWQEAVTICATLTKNANRQHRTIFRPLGRLASSELWANEGLKEERMLKRRQRLIAQVNVAAQAAESYLKDLRSDIHGLLQTSGLSEKTREAVVVEIEQGVLENYRHGAFSSKEAAQYLERQHRFYQLLADNPRGYTLRGGSLYFYSGNLRARVEELGRALMNGKADFYNNWQQIVTR